LPWFAHAARLIHLIETGRRGDILWSVLPGIKLTMCFCFKLGLVLVKSDCGITASVVWTSQSTSAQCIFAHFEKLSACEKAQSVALTHTFLALKVTISVATVGDISLDLGFSCFICGSGVFIQNLGFV